MCIKSALSIISWQTTFIRDDVVVMCILTCHSLMVWHWKQPFLLSLLRRDYVPLTFEGKGLKEGAEVVSSVLIC